MNEEPNNSVDNDSESPIDNQPNQHQETRRAVPEQEQSYQQAEQANQPTNSPQANFQAPPAETSTQPTQEQSTTVSAGVIVLGWLTYAFWGWLILSVIWLAFIIFANFITQTTNEEIIPYAIAASFVLLPIAFVCDMFYRKHEPIKKTGALMVIMVIHAVIFALLGIGALIAAVFTAVSILITSPFDIEARIVAILTAITAAILYSGAFLRTLNPQRKREFPKIYGFGMLGLTIILLILGIVGPAMQSIAARNDKVIENGLPDISYSISNYVRSNQKLPDTLKDIAVNDRDSNYLIDNKLVEYKKDSTATPKYGSPLGLELRYQLCVEYKQASPSQYDYYAPKTNEEEYASHLSTYRHDAGKQCYKLKETIYPNNSSSNKTNPLLLELGEEVY